MSHSSSKRMSSGMSGLGTSSPSGTSGSGNVAWTRSPSTRRSDLSVATVPLMVTSPDSTSLAQAEREGVPSCAARKTSRRMPSAEGSTRYVCVMVMG